MPRYDFECAEHGVCEDVWARIHEETFPCPKCGEPMKRLISLPAIVPDFEPYLHENLDDKPVPIYSKQHLQQEMEKRGLSNQYGMGKQSQRKWF